MQAPPPLTPIPWLQLLGLCQEVEGKAGDFFSNNAACGGLSAELSMT